MFITFSYWPAVSKHVWTHISMMFDKRKKKWTTFFFQFICSLCIFMIFFLHPTPKKHLYVDKNIPDLTRWRCVRWTRTKTTTTTTAALTTTTKTSRIGLFLSRLYKFKFNVYWHKLKSSLPNTNTIDNGEHVRKQIPEKWAAKHVRIELLSTLKETDHRLTVD